MLWLEAIVSWESSPSLCYVFVGFLHYKFILPTKLAMFSSILQVFDSPHLQILVGKRVRKRLDAKSIVQLLRGFDAPIGMIWFLHHLNF